MGIWGSRVVKEREKGQDGEEKLGERNSVVVRLSEEVGNLVMGAVWWWRSRMEHTVRFHHLHTVARHRGRKLFL